MNIPFGTITRFPAIDLGYTPLFNMWNIFDINDWCFDQDVTNELVDAFLQDIEEMQDEDLKIKAVTELALVVNHKAWQHADDKDTQKCETYSDLYYKVRDFVYEDGRFNKEQLRYYFEVTD